MVHAGYTPDKKPKKRQVNKLINRTVKSRRKYRLAIRSARLIIYSMIHDNTTPGIPPSKVRIMFSVRNWYTSVDDDAPNACLTPISDDRSMIRVILILTRFSVGSMVQSNTNMTMAV